MPLVTQRRGGHNLLDEDRIMSTPMSASLALLWMRPDLTRDQAHAYWAGPHSQLVGRTPGFREYRQHHFTADSPGAWPKLEGVQTVIPHERRIDGMPEVVFEHAWSPAAGRAQTKKVRADECNVFARTVLHLTGPRGGRSRRTGYGEAAKSRVVVLVRRREGVQHLAFRKFVHETLTPALEGDAGVVDLRSYTFLRFAERMWDTPGVAHDYPSAMQFHGAIVLGTTNRAVLDKRVATANRELAAGLREHCAAIHAYDVEQTYAFVRDGRPTLPQLKPERKPRLDPVLRTDIPEPTARAKQLTSAAPFPRARLVPLSGADPEDVIVDDEGRAIVGVADGRILRVDVDRRIEETLGSTEGRPLGLELLPDGRIVVCDARRGLLCLNPETGNVASLVYAVNEVPLRFCSNATAAPDGSLWFTESTSRYDFEHFVGALIEHRGSGRLIRRHPDGTVEVVLEDLHFANGLTVTEDGSGVLFAETGAARINRYDIASKKVSVVASNLPGYPDNLSRLRDGRFWVALAGPRDPALEKLAAAPPLLRKAIWRLPDRLIPEGRTTTWVMAFDCAGNELADFQQNRQDFYMATGVAEYGNRLFVASPRHSSLLVLDLPESEKARP